MTALEFITHPNVKIVSASECAKAKYRVCSVHQSMADLKEETCSGCGTTVYYDPSVPIGPDQKIICLLCVMEVARDL